MNRYQANPHAAIITGDVRNQGQTERDADIAEVKRLILN
jgi:hypothetical protein